MTATIEINLSDSLNQEELTDLLELARRRGGLNKLVTAALRSELADEKSKPADQPAQVAA